MKQRHTYNVQQASGYMATCPSSKYAIIKNYEKDVRTLSALTENVRLAQHLHRAMHTALIETTFHKRNLWPRVNTLGNTRKVARK